MTEANEPNQDPTPVEPAFVEPVRTSALEWSTIEKIPLEGLAAQWTRRADTLNRQIDDLLRYRAKVDAGSPLRPMPPGTAIDEALRREVVLRCDLTKFNKLAGRGDEANAAAFKAAYDALTERGTHTHG